MHRQNCTSYKDGKCLHQAAPRQLIGSAYCILDWPQKDPRIPGGCKLQTEYLRPKPTPPGDE